MAFGFVSARDARSSSVTTSVRSAVSIAPLRYGAGMKGKVGDAMAASLPVVTTSVGAEGFGAVSGEHLVIADDTTSFVQAVVDVYTDEARWSMLSSGGRGLVNERFSTEAGRRRVRQILERLGSS